MSEQEAILEKVQIKNFLSLRNVTLPLKPLTVLVGPNASGKSNSFEAFEFINRIMSDDPIPSNEDIQYHLWAGEATQISFSLHTKIDNNNTFYEVNIIAKNEKPFNSEKLTVNETQIISIQCGTGTVCDEDGNNITQYKSDKLALSSAGDYGEKPITNILSTFIKGWEFYDFEPERIRRGLFKSATSPIDFAETPILDDQGRIISDLLTYWHKNQEVLFNNVSSSLAAVTKLRIDYHKFEGMNQLCIVEDYKKPIPLTGASDGTLRLLAYFILINQPNLSPLIVIEEPERNLHPGALPDIASILEQLAKRTQVIITTHSSHLLDAFNPDNISDSLGVLLLRNRPGLGTEVLNLEDIRDKREALDGWISDFGIGSAIFDSQLLQDLLEEPA